LAAQRGREGGGAARRGEDCAAAPGRLGSGVKKKKGKGGGEADRRGPVVSVRGKKRKERRVTGRCGRVLVGRQAGWAKGKGGKLFFFFLFFFKLFLNQTLLFKFKPNSFKPFTKIL
jgi:hypothetical protein